MDPGRLDVPVGNEPADADGGLQLTPRPVAESVEHLLAGARRLGDYEPAESRSSARFESVELDGERLVVKYVDIVGDFSLRVMGQLEPGLLRVWRLGLMDVAPDTIDHAALGAAPWGRHGVALLMRDVGGDLVPPGDDPVSAVQQVGFLDALAAVAAGTWGQRDPYELVSMGTRWALFGDGALAGEEQAGFSEPVVELAVTGWRRFSERVPPRVAGLIAELRDDPDPLVRAVAATPSAFLHGDWKFSNLGTAADGRTVLVDWALPGFGPICHELAWYLSLNRARLPHGSTKESTAEAFAAALERRGVSTSGWWDRQLGLCLLGALVQFGWEKALGDDDELAWWCAVAIAGAEYL